MIRKADGYDGEEEMDCEPSHINQPNKRRYKGLMDKLVISTPPDILQGRKKQKEYLEFVIKNKERRLVDRLLGGSMMMVFHLTM